MKKLVLVSLLIFSSLFIHASHLLGGTISWRCLPTGQFIFEMELYRDCIGIPWTYQNETIEIVGNPLPTNGRTSIHVKPDSDRWTSSNNGTFTTQCDTSNGGVQFSCANDDPGTVQTFYYTSDPISLRGTPPANGWKFYWEAPCCLPTDLYNINSGGQRTLLKTILYPLPTGAITDSCYDSSPRFVEKPDFLLCRSQTINSAVIAEDWDLDSLVYSLGQPVTIPLTNPQPLAYQSGFTFNNPTQDTSFDSRNIPFTLNSLNGAYQLANYSSLGRQKYYIVDQVDSYKSGVKISSVFREYPIFFYDCPEISIGVKNKAPKIEINGVEATNYVLEVVGGQKVELPIKINDGSLSENQEITLIPRGSLFSLNRYSNLPCNVSGIGSCAILQSETPVLDSTFSPPLYTIDKLDTINTNFEWQTKCNYFFRGNNASIFNFYQIVRDDYCPLPSKTVAAITIKIKPAIPLNAPVMIGPSVNLDGSVLYQWIPPADSGFSFKKYEVEQTRSLNNQPPQQWTSVNNNEINFQQSGKTGKVIPYELTNPLDPNSGYDLLKPFTQFDWYMRMRTFSGCNDTSTSLWSDASRIMELTTTPVGVPLQDISPRSKIRLDWNPSGKQDIQYPAHHIYHARTRYYVHSNDSVSNRMVGDSSRWKVIDNTYDTSIVLKSTNCNGFVAFRIEARDTVVILQQGASFNNPLYDTLTFSTFSVIDTIFSEFAFPVVRTVGLDYLESDVYSYRYQWIDCSDNSLISGATSKSFVPTKSGEYKILVGSSNDSRCSDTSDCFTTTTLNDTVVLYGTDSLVSSALNGIRYQWINCKDNLPITGANSKFYVVSDTGFYAVIVNAYGYSDTSDCIPVFAISVPEFNFRKELKYYPNPTTGSIFIHTGIAYQKLQVRVRNIHGQLTEEFLFSNKESIELNLNGDAGIYFIEILNEKGEKANLKVVKQ